MIRNSDIKWFNYSKELSNLSDVKKAKLGCACVYKNRLISIGYNKEKTSTLQKKYNIYRFNSDDSPHKIHAETDCLTKLIGNRNYDDIDFRKIKLYIYREKRNGDLGMSRPCDSCLRLIKDMGIRNIYYTTDDGYCHENISY